MSHKELVELKHILLQRMDDLEKESKQLQVSIRELPNHMPDEVDQAEVIILRNQMHMRHARLLEHISTVKDVLKSLEQGYYGICSTCGEDIESARLRAIPTCSNCLHCQEELDNTAASYGRAV